MQESAVVKQGKAISDSESNELLMAVIAYINSDVTFQRYISAIICIRRKKSELIFFALQTLNRSIQLKLK